MLASDLIHVLDNLIKAHGDLPVVDEDNHLVDVEFNDDEGDEVFVVA